MPDEIDVKRNLILAIIKPSTGHADVCGLTLTEDDLKEIYAAVGGWWVIQNHYVKNPLLTADLEQLLEQYRFTNA